MNFLVKDNNIFQGKFLNDILIIKKFQYYSKDTREIFLSMGQMKFYDLGSLLKKFTEDFLFKFEKIQILFFLIKENFR